MIRTDQLSDVGATVGLEGEIVPAGMGPRRISFHSIRDSVPSRQLHFEAVFRRDGQEVGDAFELGRPRWPGQACDGLSNLREKLLEACRRQYDQHLSRFCADVFVPVNSSPPSREGE